MRLYDESKGRVVERRARTSDCTCRKGSVGFMVGVGWEEVVFVGREVDVDIYTGPGVEKGSAAQLDVT